MNPEKNKPKIEQRKEVISPVSFELTLKHTNKMALVDVVNWLLINGNHSFQWEMKLEQSQDIYYLYIETSWAENLEHIATILKKYEL